MGGSVEGRSPARKPSTRHNHRVRPLMKIIHYYRTERDRRTMPGEGCKTKTGRQAGVARPDAVTRSMALRRRQRYVRARVMIAGTWSNIQKLIGKPMITAESAQAIESHTALSHQPTSRNHSARTRNGRCGMSFR